MYFQSDEMSHGASQLTRAEYTRRPAWFSTGNDLSAARAGRLLDIVEQLRPRVALVLQSTQVPTEFDGEVGVVGKFVAYSWGREAEGAGVVVWLDRKVFPEDVGASTALSAGRGPVRLPPREGWHRQSQDLLGATIVSSRSIASVNPEARWRGTPRTCSVNGAMIYWQSSPRAAALSSSCMRMAEMDCQQMVQVMKTSTRAQSGNMNFNRSSSMAL